MLKDDDGNTMKGTIFGDDIEMFDEAIVRNGEYEISNVVIKSVPEQFRPRSGNYEMNFNEKVRIKPLDLTACSSEPQYRPLCNIPCNQIDEDALIDLVAVVLYVSEVRLLKREDAEDKVRDIVIADQSLTRPMKISAWNRYAEHEAPFLQSWPAGFLVIGFTGIQPITYKGISLVTTPSTTFVESPAGELADLVKTWANENKHMLEDWRGKAILLNNDSSEKKPVPLDVMTRKKASTIWQDEKFWIQATIFALETKDIFCYTGCNKCGCSVTDKLGTKFVCSKCKAENATAVTRALMNVLVYDKTGSLKVTSYTNEFELIIGLKTDEITALKQSDNTEAIAKKIAAIRQKEMLLQIGPLIHCL